MKSRLNHLIGLAAVLASGASVAAGNLVPNGSFEAAGPVLVAGSYCYLGYAPLECGSLPGWTGELPVMTSASSAWGVPSSLANWSSALGGMQVGLQNTSHLEQLLALAAGRYTLSWVDAGRAGYNDARYTVSFDGQSLGSFATASGQGWSVHTVTFTAAGSGTLSFQGISFAGAGADRTAFIDGVSLTAAVPEPASAAMLLAGLCGLGVFAARRVGLRAQA